MLNDERFKIRRDTDNEMYSDAFRDLLSILGISTLDDERKVKKSLKLMKIQIHLLISLNICYVRQV